MSYSNIDFKVENALFNLVEAERRAELGDMPVYRGFEGIELSSPRIEVEVVNAEMEIIGATKTGNYWATVELRLVTPHSELDNDGRQIYDRETRGRMEAELFDIVLHDDLIADLNIYRQDEEVEFYGEAGDTGAGAGIDEPVSIAADVSGFEYRKTLSFRLYCRASRS